MQSDPAHIPDLQHPRALLQYSATRPVFAIALQHRACHIKDPHNLAERQLPLSGDLSVMPAYARDAYRKTQATAGETTKVMEQTYSAASKGAADFNFHLLDITQANMNAAFDFARQLTRVTSPSEFFELSTAHVRKQVERLTEQTQDLTHLVQKVTTQAAQPLQAVARTFNQSS